MVLVPVLRRLTLDTICLVKDLDTRLVSDLALVVVRSAMVDEGA